MRGAVADNVAVFLVVFFGISVISVTADTCGREEESVSGDILTVHARQHTPRFPHYSYMDFSLTIDLDDGRVVICPIHSESYGSLLYRLYQKRTPEMPLLRERVRVVVGRHSGLTVCRGLAARGQQH